MPEGEGSQQKKKTTRKENWTAEEVRELRAAFLDNSSTIEGRLSPYLSNKEKGDAWKDIEERVNAQGSCARSLYEIRKKLSDIKTTLKKKERWRRAECEKTGGGPVPPLQDWEEKMLNVLGEVAVAGFGGQKFDLFKNQAQVQVQGPSETFNQENIPIRNPYIFQVPPTVRHDYKNQIFVPPQRPIEELPQLNLQPLTANSLSCAPPQRPIEELPQLNLQPLTANSLSCAPPQRPIEKLPQLNLQPLTANSVSCAPPQSEENGSKKIDIPLQDQNGKDSLNLPKQNSGLSKKSLKRKRQSQGDEDRSIVIQLLSQQNELLRNIYEEQLKMNEFMKKQHDNPFMLPL